MLTTYLRAIDPELRQKTAAVDREQSTFTADPALKALRDQLELATRPVAARSQSSFAYGTIWK